MKEIGTDVTGTLALGRAKVGLQMLGLAVLLVVGGAILLFFQEWPTTQDRLLGIGCLALGVILLIRQLLVITMPGKPLLSLSSEGLRLNVDGTDFVVIPWSEVEEVTAIDVKVKSLFEDASRRVSLAEALGGWGQGNVDVYRAGNGVDLLGDS